VLKLPDVADQTQSCEQTKEANDTVCTAFRGDTSVLIFKSDRGKRNEHNEIQDQFISWYDDCR
jgi:hypothetical protein